MLPLLIAGGILLALAALLLAPVRLELSFREAFSAQVRYLFFRIPLAPGKEEEPGDYRNIVEARALEHLADRLVTVSYTHLACPGHRRIGLFCS